MAHQEDYRGPYGGSDVMRDDEMRQRHTDGRDMHTRDMQGRDMQGRDMQGGSQQQQWRGGPDQYGMEAGGDWHRDGESYGPPYNQNAGQQWQQSEFGHGRGSEGQGNYGQGYYGAGMNSPSNSSRGNYRGNYRGGSSEWQGGGREYGWSPSEGYNTQPYSAGGYYGGYYGRGRNDIGDYGYDAGTQSGYRGGYSGDYGRGAGNWGDRAQGGQGRQQNHAGRGPRNYQRSDERIREDVNEELTRHPGIDASDIDVRVEHGDVTLSGTVEDRRAKRLAEDVAEQCSGVHDVRNELHVENAGRQNQSSRQGGSERASHGGSRGGSGDREVPRRAEQESARHASGTSTVESESESGRGKSSGASKNAS